MRCSWTRLGHASSSFANAATENPFYFFWKGETPLTRRVACITRVFLPVFTSHELPSRGLSPPFVLDLALVYVRLPVAWILILLEARVRGLCESETWDPVFCRGGTYPRLISL